MNISWLSLDVHILDDEKIKLIRKYPGGNELFILWIGLLCLGMKSENTGYVEISPGIPYEAQDLASLFDIDIKTVQFGLQLFSSEKFKMIKLSEMNTIEICNFLKHQRVEQVQRIREQTRLRVAKYREVHKMLVSANKIEDGNALLTQEKRDGNDTHIHNNTNNKEQITNIKNGTNAGQISDKCQTKLDIELELKQDIKIEEKPVSVKPKKQQPPPTREEARTFFLDHSFPASLADRFFDGYEAADWHDSKGKKVGNWKQKAIHVWFKDENKVKEEKKVRSL